MENFMPKVWLITGSGNGLGRHITEAALASGDSVIAGARRTEELAPLEAQYGERVKPVTLEVRDEAAAKKAVQLAVDTFGRLDVLVNNAGYGQFAPFEQMSAEDFQAAVVHLLLRRRLHNARRHTGNAQAEERSHSGFVSRWPHGDRRQHALSRGQVGRGRFQRRSGDGGRTVRGQGLHSGAGRHSNQLGTTRRAECPGSAARVRGLGRFDTQAAAKSRRTFGRRSAE